MDEPTIAEIEAALRNKFYRPPASTWLAFLLARVKELESALREITECEERWRLTLEAGPVIDAIRRACALLPPVPVQEEGE